MIHRLLVFARRDRKRLAPVGLVWHKLHPVSIAALLVHDDVIKLKHFPRNWPFVRGIHRSPVNFPHKGQWRGALMFSLICVWINDWVNHGEPGDLRRYRINYDVTVMRNRFCLRHITSYCIRYSYCYPSATYLFPISMGGREIIVIHIAYCFVKF